MASLQKAVVHSSQGQVGSAKFHQLSFSGCLQTQASLCLSTYSWRVISFPWPQEIDWKTHLWVLEQNKAAEKMCCQMMLPLRPPLVWVFRALSSLLLPKDVIRMQGRRSLLVVFPGDQQLSEAFSFRLFNSWRLGSLEFCILYYHTNMQQRETGPILQQPVKEKSIFLLLWLWIKACYSLCFPRHKWIII